MLDSILSHLTAAPWRDTVQYFDTITSTNDVLKELAAQGAPEGTTLVAGCQTGGRGVNSIQLYGEYLKGMMKYTHPYGMIPSGVYQAEEYKDTTNFYEMCRRDRPFTYKASL